MKGHKNKAQTNVSLLLQLIKFTLRDTVGYAWGVFCVWNVNRNFCKAGKFCNGPWGDEHFCLPVEKNHLVQFEYAHFIVLINLSLPAPGVGKNMALNIFGKRGLVARRWCAHNGPGAHWYQEWCISHYCDVIMGANASQITSLTIVYSTVYSGADQTKHQSSASLAFVQGIHRWPVNSPHKWPITPKMFPFDDVIMSTCVTR